MMGETENSSWWSTSGSNSGKTENSSTYPSETSDKSISIPKKIQSILPEKAKIENMGVQNISPTEKLFKITLDSWAIRYVQVKKESGKY
jgi:hypothetical protein